MKTLAMRKMEKNFLGHIEKGYPRKPYEAYDLDHLTNRFCDEGLELMEAIESKDFERARSECADVTSEFLSTHPK